jgi:hypothetical protein
MRLDPEQLAFLSSQKVPLSVVFDATGMRKVDYAEAMKSGGFHFAYGTTPCGKGGHTLRTRAGHCIQCDTSKIAFQMRHRTPGHVYLAGSAKTNLFKVGTTNDLAVREWQLRDWRYGGAADWEVLLSSHVANAGAIEFGAQHRLRHRSEPGTYIRDGRTQGCYELFRCSYDEAREALIAVLPAGSLQRESAIERSRRLWPGAGG